MNLPMRRAVLAAAALVLMAASAGRARAAIVVDFSYSGQGGPDEAGLVSTGTGSFSFADGLATVGLADLASFAFTLEENTPNAATFGLADLASFSASVGPGATLAGLALATGAVQGTNPETWPREFAISSLDPGGATTHVRILGVSLLLTSGTVTITSVSPAAVPEPSTLAAAALGALVVALGRPRRREARAAARRPGRGACAVNRPAAGDPGPGSPSA